jgi:hypothetical protein
MTSRKFLWRPRFSLRTLLIVTALVASVAAWFTHTTLRQRRVVAALTKLGADVAYEDNSNPHLKSWYPQWLRNWLGIDFFAKATVVTFGDANSVSRSKLGTRSTNVHSRGRITQGQQGTRNVLWNVVGEEAMQQVRRLPNLQKLTIKAFTAKQASSPSDYPIFAKLEAHDELHVPALQLLKNHPTLEELELPSRITDAGLRHLSKLTKLESLCLNDLPITDAGLEHLRGATGMSSLALSGTKITDAGLAQLSGMTGLQTLILSSTSVTDESVDQLLRFKNLKEVTAYDAGISRAVLSD